MHVGGLRWVMTLELITRDCKSDVRGNVSAHADCVRMCVFRRSRLPNSRRRISGLLWRRSRRPKLKRSVEENWVLCVQVYGSGHCYSAMKALVNDSWGHNSSTHTHIHTRMHALSEREHST